MSSRAARPATPGGEKTQDYLAKQLSALGIEPGAPDGTYFQQVPIVESVVERNFVLSVPGNTYKYFTDVVAFSGVEKPRVQVQGDVVFVGYGINAPELKWNDYDGANVRGKWVMIMVNDPPAPADEPTLFGGTALTYYGRWTYKFEEAARQGAAGALLIHTDESATYPWQVVQSSWSGTQYSLPPQAGEPALGIKALDHQRRGEGSRAARRPRSRHDARRGQQARLQGGDAQHPRRRDADAALGAEDRGQRDRRDQGHQPVGGRDLFGALGSLRHRATPQPGDAKDADRIFNGAYDNASGCAGVLEIAKAFAKAPQKPARSIYFAFVTAEESGLLGSAFLAANPPLPIDKIAANINIDGVNYLGADERHGAARLGALVDRPDDRGDPEGAQPHADRRHASGARLLLPLGSLLVREARRAGDLAERAETVHRAERGGAAEEAGSLQRQGLSPAERRVRSVVGFHRRRQRHAACSRSLAGASRSRPEMPKYNAGDQFARGQEEIESDTT